MSQRPSSNLRDVLGFRPTPSQFDPGREEMEAAMTAAQAAELRQRMPATQTAAMNSTQHIESSTLVRSITNHFERSFNASHAILLERLSKQDEILAKQQGLFDRVLDVLSTEQNESVKEQKTLRSEIHDLKVRTNTLSSGLGEAMKNLATHLTKTVREGNEAMDSKLLRLEGVLKGLREEVHPTTNDDPTVRHEIGVETNAPPIVTYRDIGTTPANLESCPPSSIINAVFENWDEAPPQGAEKSLVGSREEVEDLIANAPTDLQSSPSGLESPPFNSEAPSRGAGESLEGVREEVRDLAANDDSIVVDEIGVETNAPRVATYCDVEKSPANLESRPSSSVRSESPGAPVDLPRLRPITTWQNLAVSSTTGSIFENWDNVPLQGSEEGLEGLRKEVQDSTANDESSVRHEIGEETNSCVATQCDIGTVPANFGSRVGSLESRPASLEPPINQRQPIATLASRGWAVNSTNSPTLEDCCDVPLQDTDDDPGINDSNERVTSIPSIHRTNIPSCEDADSNDAISEEAIHQILNPVDTPSDSSSAPPSSFHDLIRSSDNDIEHCSSADRSPLIIVGTTTTSAPRDSVTVAAPSGEASRHEESRHQSVCSEATSSISLPDPSALLGHWFQLRSQSQVKVADPTTPVEPSGTNPTTARRRTLSWSSMSTLTSLSSLPNDNAPGDNPPLLVTSNKHDRASESLLRRGSKSQSRPRKRRKTSQEPDHKRAKTQGNTLGKVEKSLLDANSPKALFNATNVNCGTTGDVSGSVKMTLESKTTTSSAALHVWLTSCASPLTPSGQYLGLSNSLSTADAPRIAQKGDDACSRPNCSAKNPADAEEYFIDRFVGRYDRKLKGVARYSWLIKWEGYTIDECGAVCRVANHEVLRVSTGCPREFRYFSSILTPSVVHNVDGTPDMGSTMQASVSKRTDDDPVDYTIFESLSEEYIEITVPEPPPQMENLNQAATAKKWWSGGHRVMRRDTNLAQHVMDGDYAFAESLRDELLGANIQIKRHIVFGEAALYAWKTKPAEEKTDAFYQWVRLFPNAQLGHIRQGRMAIQHIRNELFKEPSDLNTLACLAIVSARKGFIRFIIDDVITHVARFAPPHLSSALFDECELAAKAFHSRHKGEIKQDSKFSVWDAEKFHNLYLRGLCMAGYTDAAIERLTHVVKLKIPISTFTWTVFLRDLTILGRTEMLHLVRELRSIAVSTPAPDPANQQTMRVPRPIPNLPSAQEIATSMEQCIQSWNHELLERLRNQIFEIHGSLDLWVTSQMKYYQGTKQPKQVLQQFLAYYLCIGVPKELLHRCISQPSSSGFHPLLPIITVPPTLRRGTARWPSTHTLTMVWQAIASFSSTRESLMNLYRSFLAYWDTHEGSRNTSTLPDLSLKDIWYQIRFQHPPVMTPDTVMFHIFIVGFARLQESDAVLGVLEDMNARAIRPDAHNWTAVAGMYARMADPLPAERILTRMEADLPEGAKPAAAVKSRDIIRSRTGPIQRPASWVPAPTLVTYTSILRGLVDERRYKEARIFSERMQTAGYIPGTDERTEEIDGKNTMLRTGNRNMALPSRTYPAKASLIIEM
ncbi:hypothetical protein BU17DRAFT_84932 [Hysterangium stoloniferum]|nr:hypothetical protein BU17DRAFT_84932 [Hysterangium stoloniferum]